MDQRVLHTKQALTTALFTLLQQQPIERITVTALCQTAHINRRTFYIHYDHVSDIFDDYQIDLAQEVAQALTGQHASTVQLVATFDKILMANLTGFQYLCLSRQHHHLIEDLQQMLFETLCDNLLTNQTPGTAQLVLSSLTAGLINTYIYWFSHPDTITYQTLVTTNQQLVRTHLALLPQ
ncbi:TetR/AcrR family transcriptional regulator [Lactiplantibacillus daowaiensis]|uniref:TetR/AcrR family transcriptional regulator n=1 Tax=Lactiplantibacillus daowaiensis TaxID=2559918 RepID=A0ABW1RZS6_9LACO|nr:TetR/AcrR family transcriptional regulator [Lactiplantibacillus daowaiensis]